MLFNQEPNFSTYYIRFARYPFLYMSLLSAQKFKCDTNYLMHLMKVQSK